jgi:hypothetical protein
LEIKLSEHEFVIKTIKKLSHPPYKGIHSVYSGFNHEFRDYFQKDPIEATTRLAEEGKIETRMAKGGAKLYLLGDAPSSSKNAFNKIASEEDSGKT